MMADFMVVSCGLAKANGWFASDGADSRVTVAGDWSEGRQGVKNRAVAVCPMFRFIAPSAANA